MRRKISQVLNSRRAAFIFSVILSFCIWIKLSTSSSEHITRTITNIPITVNLSESAKEAGLEVFGLDDVFAEVTVTGNRISLGQLTKDNITVFAQQSAGMINTTGNYTLELSARKNGRPSDYEISNQVSPKFINVFVDRRYSKSFDITSNIICNTDSEHFITSAAISEPSVTISGPESIISSIGKVCIEKNFGNKLTETVSLKDLPLVLYDENGKKMPSTNLTFSTNKVDATVSVFSKKTVKIVPSFVNGPANLSEKKVALDPSRIEIAASKEILDSIDSVPLETLDFSNINIHNNGFELPVKLPSGVRNLSNVYLVNLKLNTDGFQSKFVKVDSIVFKNKRENQSATSYTKSINAEIIGPYSDLKNIKSEDIYAQVDLSGKENFKGITELPVTIKFFSYAHCWAYGKYSVTVQID